MVAVIAVTAFGWFWRNLGNHHTFIFLFAWFSVSSEAFISFTDTNRFGLSLELHHFFSKELDHLHVVLFEKFHIVVSETNMLSELSSLKWFHTDIALNHNFRAVPLNMISQLSSRHVLEFLKVADVTTVLGALIVLCMLLELSNGFPNDFTIWSFITLMREFAEIDAVSYNWVDLLENVSLALAMWACNDVHYLLLSVEVISFLIIFSRKGLPW